MDKKAHEFSEAGVCLNCRKAKADAGPECVPKKRGIEAIQEQIMAGKKR